MVFNSDGVVETIIDGELTIILVSTVLAGCGVVVVVVVVVIVVLADLAADIYKVKVK